MNERILELRTQAAAWVAKNHQPQDPNAYSQKEIDQRYLMYEEKFAELIVQECLDTIQRGIDNGGGANEDIVMAGKLALFYSYRNIQARFGMGDYKDPEHSGVES